MATFGKVHDLTKEFNFEWKIDNFFSLSEESGKPYNSPLFSFAGESWFLSVYPNGDPEDNSVGCIGVYLNRDLSGSPIINLTWTFGLKTVDGKKVHEKQCAYAFGEDDMGWGSPVLLKRSTLFGRKSELVPSDILTIVFSVDYCSKSSDDSGNTVTAKCSHCKKTWDAEHISSHEQKCLDKPMRCPTCGSVVALGKLIDHECDASRLKATKKLVDDLADILESEEHSDVTIRVKAKEFRLHRSILAGRNPYFYSMFKTEMKEKNTGVVSIDDCEPDIFHSFINFVYTGKVRILSCDNVCALYEVADKYQEDQLKSECLCYMKNEISVENFCEFIALALKHGDKELLQTATDFFCRKTKEIILSVKWQTFLREYPTQANELYIKAHDYNAK